MSTGPIMDHFWVFVAGVAAAPFVGAYATAALVQWWTARRGFVVEAARWRLAGVALVLFVLVPLVCGAILHATHGIPPGLGFAGTLGFLLATCGGPVALAAYLFARFVGSRLSSQGRDPATSLPDERVRADRVVAETGLWFAGSHLALYPALFVLAILAS